MITSKLIALEMFVMFDVSGSKFDVDMDFDVSPFFIFF